MRHSFDLFDLSLIWFHKLKLTLLYHLKNNLNPLLSLNKNDNYLIEIGKRRSPRPHWRKGHWHTVLQAPGRKQKRLKWFRPCFVQPKQLQEVNK